jgi:hypothetical protein
MAAMATPQQILDRFGFGSNDRVAYSGMTGHIAFTGETDFAPGGWVGVILDPGFAGKNNGSVQGKSYFTCDPSRGNCGIFVRPEFLKHADEEGGQGEAGWQAQVAEAPPVPMVRCCCSFPNESFCRHQKLLFFADSFSLVKHWG